MSTNAGSDGVGGVISLRKEILGLETGTDTLEALERVLSSVAVMMVMMMMMLGVSFGSD
jgi:hypothetical protein